MKLIETPILSNRVEIYDRSEIIDNQLMIKIDFAERLGHIEPKANFCATIYGKKEVPKGYYRIDNAAHQYCIGYYAGRDFNGNRLSRSNHAILPSQFFNIYSLLGDLEKLESYLIELCGTTLTASDLNAELGRTALKASRSTCSVSKSKRKPKPKSKRKVDSTDDQLDLFGEIA